MKRIRRVEVNIVRTDGRVRIITKPGPGRAFTSEGVDGILAHHAEQIEKQLPGREFRLVPLSGGYQFNFVEIPKSESECATQT